jgi:glycosyltransferase involved in cell wall biosynthesis
VAVASNAQPLFSLVSAAYDVGRYLDAYIASLEAQTIGPDRFEVIVVDDGSTDDTLERLRAWEASTGLAVRVVSQVNAGQGAARNAGMAEARGTWVGFPDPDDVLDAGYLESVASFLGFHPDTDLVATHRLLLDDHTGKVTNSHPLRKFFRDGDVVRDLSVDTDLFHGSAPAAFFRRDRIGPGLLEFDPRVRPNFEDGHFTSRYLLSSPAPTIGFVASARYEYRKRADASSTLQAGRSDARRYTDVLRYGYLDALRTGAQRYGTAPEWLQHFVLYELSWYFSSEGTIIRPGPAGEVAAELHELMPQILALLDPGVIETTDLPRLRRLARLVLLHGYADQRWCEQPVRVSAVDRDQRLVRLSYYFTGEPPTEQVDVGGQAVRPAYAKTRDVVVHERVLLRERLLWVSSRAPVRLRLDGRTVDVRLDEPTPVQRVVRPLALTRIEPRTGILRDDPVRPLSAEDRALLGRAESRSVRRRYADAWVLMDRVHDADDSAEHLFAWLRAEHPEVNAWFTVEEGTPDWHRLRKAGHGKRLVGYGSEEWKLLLLHARHVISSHAEPANYAPDAVSHLPTDWRFTFLQHGVIKDDLASWLNVRPIDLFVTSTPDEHASVTADHTSYVFTGKEAVRTGLPRFDVLLEAAAAVPRDRRDLVLVAPTWRNWLVRPLDKDSQRREDIGAAFLDSDFVRQWLALLTSPRLQEACERHGLTLAFLPHPNLQPSLPRLDLPAHVRTLGFDDVRGTFARTALLVTDYSSMAFNAAYLERPVVYHQFDADRMFGGDHIGRGGYFDYHRDGFGPVTSSPDEAVASVVEILDGGATPPAEYLARITAAFPERDGQCRRRVFDAIVASTEPAPAAAPVTPDPPAV